MSTTGQGVSRYAAEKGILFAADFHDKNEMFRCIERIAGDISAIKIGNVVAYGIGLGVISELRRYFGLPIVADLKITDIDHIAAAVVNQVAGAGADVVVLSGICGPSIIGKVLIQSPKQCEVWLFTEFTCMDGLIDEALADNSIRIGRNLGIKGFQVPATRPERISVVRSMIGPECGIMTCGVGRQGGTITSAIENGANWIIVGRSIYEEKDPGDAAHQLRLQIPP